VAPKRLYTQVKVKVCSSDAEPNIVLVRRSLSQEPKPWRRIWRRIWRRSSKALVKNIQ